MFFTSSSTLINARNKTDIEITQNTNVFIKSINITNHVDNDEAFRAIRLDFNDVTLKEVIVTDNHFGGSLYFFSQKYNDKFDIINCNFNNNEPSLNGCIQLFIRLFPSKFIRFIISEYHYCPVINQTIPIG